MMLEKYHGLGNDYLVYDCNKNDIFLNEDQVRLICHRNFGVGSDGILVGPIFHDDKIGVRILNPDGSEAEKSGNGVRIFSKYLKDAGYIKDERFILSTLGGDVNVSYLNEAGTRLRVSMGRLSFLSDDIGVIGDSRFVVNETMSFGGKDYQCTCVSVGNPHCVIPMPEVSKELVCEIGKYSENAIYFPRRINTQIVKVLDRNNIQIEIFERGAGYTLASGSSSCAAAGAAYQLGYVDNTVTVRMPGGELIIEIMPDLEVFMTGNVCHIGKVELGEDFVEENQMH